MYFIVIASFFHQLGRYCSTALHLPLNNHHGGLSRALLETPGIYAAVISENKKQTMDLTALIGHQQPSKCSVGAPALVAAITVSRGGVLNLCNHKLAYNKDLIAHRHQSSFAFLSTQLPPRICEALIKLSLTTSRSCRSTCRSFTHKVFSLESLLIVLSPHRTFHAELFATGSHTVFPTRPLSSCHILSQASLVYLLLL
jgi:hypothetical protein